MATEKNLNNLVINKVESEAVYNYMKANNLINVDELYFIQDADGLATETDDGLMSSEDKIKLDSIEEGANNITVDSTLSSTSTNPVQNKIINAKLTSMQTDIDSRVPSSRTINSKNLSADITLTASDVGALPNTTVIPSIEGLATETYVNNKVAGLVDSAPDTLDTLNELAAALGDDPNFATTVANQIGGKVDKVDGKGLSTEDYTTIEKTKLSGIAEGAEVNVQSDWDVTNTTSDAYIKNKPNTGTSTVSGLTKLYTTTGANTDGTMTQSAITSALSDKVDIANGQYAVTTGGDGAAYTATVPGITALTAGVSFIMIPHVVSTSTSPTLNVNGLGAKNIRRRLTSIATAPQNGYTASWLGVGLPFRVVYDGTQWIAEGHDKPAGPDVYGTVPKATADADGNDIVNTYATKVELQSYLPKSTTISLLAASWTGSSQPYSQVVTINGVTVNSKVDLQPAAVQIVELQNAHIMLMTENDAGTITVYALGEKPTSDYTMQVLITETLPV